MSALVTLQLNVGHNEAGDWANRSLGDAGTIAGSREAASAPADELMVRLNRLRGVVEAMREQPHGPTLADTRTAPVGVGYGEPVMYHGICFLVRSAD